MKNELFNEGISKNNISITAVSKNLKKAYIYKLTNMFDCDSIFFRRSIDRIGFVRSRVKNKQLITCDLVKYGMRTKHIHVRN